VVTHQLQVKRRTGKVRRPETDVLPLCHATNLFSTVSDISNYNGKSELSKLLVSNSARITYEDNKNATSSAWNNYAIVVVDGKFSNHIKYVKCNAAVWPELTTVALCVLSIPATSTPSERAFSSAGRTLEERRTQLSTSSVDSLLFLRGL